MLPLYWLRITTWQPYLAAIVAVFSFPILSPAVKSMLLMLYVMALRASTGHENLRITSSLLGRVVLARTRPDDTLSILTEPRCARLAVFSGVRWTVRKTLVASWVWSISALVPSEIARRPNERLIWTNDQRTDVWHALVQPTELALSRCCSRIRVCRSYSSRIRVCLSYCWSSSIKYFIIRGQLREHWPGALWMLQLKGWWRKARPRG